MKESSKIQRKPGNSGTPFRGTRLDLQAKGGSPMAYASKSPDKTGRYTYDAAETAVWHDLYTSQTTFLQGRACKAFLTGLDKLGITGDAMPQVRDVDARLQALTGAGVEGVPALIPQDHFSRLLSQRKFPVATFIRRREDIDYIEEPDIFHEVYGHAPMLTEEPFCQFMERFGHLALSLGEARLERLFRLFWFTVEFGLIREDGALRIFGAGICSSPSEARHALSSKAEVLPFDVLTTLRTPVRIDIVQPVYFEIESFDHLVAALDCDMGAMIDKAAEMGDLPARFEAAA
ncbi:MAG: phenylalanine 4-monooxygenase [Pseudomonadota bacterium]